MTIGVTPVNTNYVTEGTIGYINGYNAANTTAPFSQAQVGQSVAFFLIQAKDVGNSAVSLLAESGYGKAIDAIFRVLPQGIIAYEVTNSSSGYIQLIVDGVNAPTAVSIRNDIRALGSAVGTNAIDLSGSLVTAGTHFVVS